MNTMPAAPDPMVPDRAGSLDHATTNRVDDQDAALLGLVQRLRETQYHFITPTPATHARVIARAQEGAARSLRDVLGWSLPFESGTIDPYVESLLHQAGMIETDGAMLRARVRVSSLSPHLFLHSAYPTFQSDTVFFGPDSYRFADLIRAELAGWTGRADPRIVDIGTGSGVGAVIASDMRPSAQVRMTDINPLALRFARINAAAAGVNPKAVECSMMDAIDGSVDIVTANPPYIIDPDSRLYRDGGAMRGGQVSFDMTKAALDRLAPGGRIILYTGSAIVGGEDALRTALHQEAQERDLDCRYRELDPDVFGEELETEAYRDVERIALVAAVLTRRA